MSFNPAAYPEWVTSFRDYQVSCAQEIVEAFKAGVPTVFLDGPTGSGKTLIGEMVRRSLNAKAIYCCHDRTLQDQFLRDFDYAKVLKGRKNYGTVYGGELVTADDCVIEGFGDDKQCLTGCRRRVDECPYRVAKEAAVESPLAVLNTAYLLAETSTAQTSFGNKSFPFLILDECDTTEKILMGAVEVFISASRMEFLKVGRPEYVTKPEAWKTWIDLELLPAVEKHLKSLPKRTSDVQKIRRRKGWEKLFDKLVVVSRGVLTGNWIFDGYQSGGAVFKPIRVDQYGPERLWKHFPRRLLMSATIVSPDELVESLGIPGDYHVVRAPMTFPVENRRIHVAPIANMTNKTKAEEWPKMAKAIGAILANHPRSQRVLVHTVSYGLAEYLKENVDTSRPKLAYRTSGDRDESLVAYRDRPGSVLFAPSLDRGVDFRDSDCRVVVVAKVPYLNLGDKQVSARLHSHGGQLWMRVQTIRSVVQMTGRGVRSESDWATSYILDTQFVSNLYRQSKHLFPQWWKDALDFTFNIKQITTRERQP